MRPRVCALHLLILFAAITGRASAQHAASPRGFADDLDRFIRQGVKDWEIPGIAIAVVEGDSTVFLRGYGVRKLGEPGPVDAETLFGMMSTTKAMTALGVAMLVDDGKLRWDDPVTKWIPEFQMPDPWVTTQVTVQDLLTHNTGLGNADLLWVREDLSLADIIPRLRLLKPAYSLRGSFIYQNVMYGIAGVVIERASGLSYPEFLRRRIFNPLGMTRSYGTAKQALDLGDPNTSVAHFRIRDTVRAIEESLVDVIPAAGSVWSSAADMALWTRFLLDSGRVAGRRLVSEENFQRLFTAHALISPEEFYPTARLTQPRWMTYGLGWFEQDYGGEFVAFHTGSMDGRTAIVGLIPSRRVGIYAFGNLDHAEFRHALMLRVLDHYLGRPPRDWNSNLLALYGGLRAEADSAAAHRRRDEVPGTSPTLSAERYAGEYEHPVWGNVLVEARSDTLRLRVGTGLQGLLRHTHYDTFAVTWGDGRYPEEPVQFVLNAEGVLAELRYGGDSFRRR